MIKQGSQIFLSKQNKHEVFHLSNDIEMALTTYAYSPGFQNYLKLQFEIKVFIKIELGAHNTIGSECRTVILFGNLIIA